LNGGIERISEKINGWTPLKLLIKVGASHFITGEGNVVTYEVSNCNHLATKRIISARE